MNDPKRIARLELHEAVAASFSATTPRPLARALEYQSEEMSHLHQQVATDDDFYATIADASATDDLVEIWRRQLSRWDYAESLAWSESPPSTALRREDIYAKLDLSDAIRRRLDELIPVVTLERPVVISDTFEPWYPPGSSITRSFYWPSYERVLQRKGWHEDAIASLNAASDSVVERLSDPTRPEAYQAKGLVVGYVQSGKTANFTGVIAKAIDAGYRMVIVLGGTSNMLRGQTQRRLDMELVGRENILRGATELESDYADDPAWLKNEFVSFGQLPSALGAFDIIRLTSKDDDYKNLLQGIVALEFEKRLPTAPLHDPRNLHSTSARLMVVKKNKDVLNSLVKDIRRMKTALEEIPVLIIDDESDEASVNTQDLSKPNTKRTQINQKIGELLALFPRAQYVGYTATPFANVFIDPSSSEDIFPRDFIVSLPRPKGYMGVQDFHDLDLPISFEDRTAENSNEKAHIRNVSMEDSEADDSSLQQAIDAFVLAGAVKMFREDRASSTKPFNHHTMLIHESRLTADHRELLIRAKRLWFNSGYFGPAGHARLRQLFEADHAIVSGSRAAGHPVPTSYDELRQFIGPTVARIGGDENPVIVVNGDKDLETGEADFDKRSIWKILIGGQQLSRGFTVEGLTVSYFRRTTTSASTLMQMGRWYGFREGYQDLVRLYLGRSETLGGKKVVDLYEAFEAICLDEEKFRSELRKYSKPIDGTPQITPAQVPPLVSQHLDWLKPVSRNKMYNARLARIETAGQWHEPTAYPSKPAEVRHNFNLWTPHLRDLDTELHTLVATNPDGVDDKLVARLGIMTPAEVIDLLNGYRWSNSTSFAPHLAYARDITEDGLVDDWLLVVPQNSVGSQRARLETETEWSWFARKRRANRAGFGAISAPRDRTPLLRIVGSLPKSGFAATEALVQPRRGVIAVYPVIEEEHRDAIRDVGIFNPVNTVMAFAFVAPASARSADGRVLRFVTIDSSKEGPIVDSIQ